MVTKEEFVEYIKENLRRGISPQGIRQKLLEYRWTDSEITEAFDIIYNKRPLEEKKLEPIPIKTITQPKIQEEMPSKSPSRIKIILIILIIIFSLAIIFTTIYFFVQESIAEEENQILDVKEKEVGCETDTDCTSYCPNCAAKKNICDFNRQICVQCTISTDCSSGYSCQQSRCVQNTAQSNSASSTRNPGSSSGSGGSSSGSGSLTIDTTDCGTNMNCFISASNSCSVKQVNHIYSLVVFGIDKTTQATYNLNGLSNSKCIFKIKIDSIEVKFTDSLIEDRKANGDTDEEIAQAIAFENSEADKEEGKEGTCYIKTEDLSSMLSSWNSNPVNAGIIPDEIFSESDCTGNYF